MSWNELDIRIAMLAAGIRAPEGDEWIREPLLTAKQLEAWKLELAGMGTRRIADALDIHRSTVLDRLAGAHRRLAKAGVRQDGSGHWYLEEAA